MSMVELEKEFEEEMLLLYVKTGEVTKKLGNAYWPKRFKQMVVNRGGLKAAKIWLQKRSGVKPGFSRLEELGRLDLSVEYLVIQRKWEDLFTQEEIKIARERLENASVLLLSEEILDINEINEGSKKSIVVNSYERNPLARKICIDYYGALCYICGFSFATVYGEKFNDFIHVHHIKPLSEIGEAYVVNPIADLRPVCPNCHSIIHRTVPAYSIEEVQEFINSTNLIKIGRKNQ